MLFHQVLSSLCGAFFVALFKFIGQARYYCSSVLRLSRGSAYSALRVLVLLSIALPLVSYLYSAQHVPHANSFAYSCDPIERMPFIERFMYGPANGTASQLTAQRKKFFGKILSERFKRNLEKIQSSGLLPEDQKRLRGFFITQEMESVERAQVLACSFSSDETILSFGLFNSTIKIWERKSNNSFSCIQTLTGHKDSIGALVFSPDGTILASACHDGTIKIWQRNYNNFFLYSDIYWS